MPIPLGVLAVAGAGGGAAASDYVRLETTLISTNTASVTFSNLNAYSAYKHLQIRLTGRSGTSGASFTNLFVRFNADSGSNYAVHWLTGSGASVSSSADSSQAQITLYDILGRTTDIAGAAVIDILDFSSSSKSTTLRSLSGGVDGSETRIYLQSGLWNNTAAVTSITLSGQSDNFGSGTRLSLYGIK
jgi:hypothetical protein